MQIVDDGIRKGIVDLSGDSSEDDAVVAQGRRDRHQWRELGDGHGTSPSDQAPGDRRRIEDLTQPGLSGPVVGEAPSEPRPGAGSDSARPPEIPPSFRSSDSSRDGLPVRGAWLSVPGLPRPANHDHGVPRSPTRTRLRIGGDHEHTS